MIRIKSVARELDEVILTVEFDWQGETHELTMRVKADILLGLTKEQVVKAIKNRVARERMSLAEPEVRKFLKDIMNVDLEGE